MTATFNFLFRLPGCIRGQAFAQLSADKITPARQDLSSIATRAFNSTTRQGAQAQKASLPPLSKSVKGVGKSATSRSSLPPPVFRASEPISYAQALLGDSNEVLLYRAPSHRSFAIYSLASGSLLFLGAYALATNANLITDSSKDTKQDKTRNRLARYAALTSAFITASLATVCILAPAAVITSISLRAPLSMHAGGKRTTILVLRAREWPFAPTKEIQLSPKEAKLDKRVSSTGDDLDYTSIPVTQARMSSVNAKTPANPPAKPGQGPIARALEALFRDTRRMFYRDGFCRLRAGENGKNWKLDLQHCEILDWGRPLDRLTSADTSPGFGPVAWIRRRIG
ncbi:hypothetical protein Tdes44962_MAKER03278 [Teratosphaeria destructans]|uniref:Uncharacterized protein n=1 Tax=Teratosphaeria destructans TaxID=418781 RepID=A0A9W7SQI0_9PEZI|nr:hypothetical protein Tdes44962_MAKER03278 [Teratosphaeria destructans]